MSIFFKKNHQQLGTDKNISTSLDIKDSSTENIGRGWSSTELSMDYDQTHLPDGNNEISHSNNQLEDSDIFDLLANLGDQLDLEQEHKLANFSDFLIKKFAEVSTEEYNFNTLMIKINLSDISNRSEIIKKLTKIYSKTILLEKISGHSLEESKKSAYKKILHRANQYLSE